MCNMHYDVIGKVETSQEDMNYIIGKVRHTFHENTLVFLAAEVRLF